MVDQNDSFIREVNEELRSDQVRNAWKRYSRWIIGAAVVIVLGTAGHRLWTHWDSTQASDAGDKFLAALNLADQGKRDEAEAALQALEQDGYGAYGILARFRAASVLAEKGDPAGAIASFKTIGDDTSIPEAVRNTAKVRAAWLLVDTGTYQDVSALVEAMATPANSMPAASTAPETREMPITRIVAPQAPAKASTGRSSDCGTASGTSSATVAPSAAPPAEPSR